MVSCGLRRVNTNAERKSMCYKVPTIYNYMFKSHTSRRFSVNINSCKLDSLEYESSKHINI